MDQELSWKYHYWKYHYYDSDGQKLGPFSLVQLKQLATEKTILPTTKILLPDGIETYAVTLNLPFSGQEKVVDDEAANVLFLLKVSTIIVGIFCFLAVFLSLFSDVVAFILTLISSVITFFMWYVIMRALRYIVTRISKND